METKFTKGKWDANPYGCNDLQVWAQDTKIADCSNLIQSSLYRAKELNEMKANALLISKAPEFYQDAKDDLELFDSILIELPLGLQHITNAIKERKKQKEQLLKEATEL